MLNFDCRQIVKMGANKVPYRILAATGLREPIFEPTIWFVCRNHEVLFNRRLIVYSVKTALFFVERRNISNYKTSFLQARLNAIPDCSLSI